MNEVDVAVNAGTPDPRFLVLQEKAPVDHKRRNPERPAVLSWCLIVRNASKTLEQCLKSIRAMTPDAEIVIVDTMSNDFEDKVLAMPFEELNPDLQAAASRGEKLVWADPTNPRVPKSVEIAKRYADVWEEYRGPKGTWTREMYAFDDAAAARNRSFELATGQFVAWIDADDELMGPEETQRLLAINGQLPPADGQTKVDGLAVESEKHELGDRRVAGLEGFLAALPKAGPEVFYCPYLYRPMPGDEGKSGKAIEWQTRERIVRRGDDGVLRWRWHRKAHEYLSSDGPVSRAAKLPTLLFVHRKEWTNEDFVYSTRRHYDIVRADYDAGHRVPFDLLYLCRYAKTMAPAQEREFVEAYVKACFMPMDRAQALSVKAGYLAREGYFHEAVEHYAAANVADPTYPEAHFGLAKTYEEADRWLDAARAYQRGCDTSPDHLYGALSPREHRVVNRLRAAHCYWKAAMQVADSEPRLELAKQCAAEAGREPGAFIVDGEALQAYINLFENELTCFRSLVALNAAAQVLIANDETLKAALLVKAIPHNMADHPIAQRMLMHAVKIDQHGLDDASYTEFYETLGTDRFTSDDELEKALEMPRVRFLVDELVKLRAKLGRPLRVLEVGPWDGISLIHCMRALPDSQFVGIEVKGTAITELQKRIDKLGWSDRLKLVHGKLSRKTITEAESGFARTRDAGGPFDAITFYEVIEHLPSPHNSLFLMRGSLTPSGVIFVSTPWGAFDRGHPANFEKRDARGHVTAMMPRDVVSVLEECSFRVLELGGLHSEGHFGDTLHLMAERIDLVTPSTWPRLIEGEGATTPVPGFGFSPQFAVHGALWDWNASLVERTGMGASEETIVYLAREFGRRGGRPQVFGPIPKTGILDQVEVRDGVQYWPREQLRYIDPSRPLIVSRAPSYGPLIKQHLKDFGIKPPRMFLWLQDCHYADLNAQVAAEYEKVIVLSHKHREQIARQGVPLEKMKIIPNFILKEHFPLPSQSSVKREPHRFIYCSSPDRGLIPLLKMWPLFRKEWPDATLGIFYGWEGAKRLGATMPGWISQYRELRAEYDSLCRQPGVEEYGRVNHHQIAYEMRRASVWPYPILNTEVETFCSNAVKARAAGCVPVVTAGMIPDEALGTAFATSLALRVPADPKQPTEDFEWAFFKAVKMAVGASDEARDAMAQQALNEFELGVVIKKWEELL